MSDEIFLRDIIRFGAHCQEMGYMRSQNPFHVFDPIERAAWERGWAGMGEKALSASIMSMIEIMLLSRP